MALATAAMIGGGALLGGLMGSKKQKQSQSAAPWGPIQPFMQGAARQGYRSLVRQPNPAIEGILAQAQGAQPVLDAATQQTLDTLGGNYLENPFTSQAVQAAIDPIKDEYTQSIVPGILGRLSSRGALSSGSAERMLGRANEGFAGALADTAGQIGFQNYNNERGRMMGALGMAPGMQTMQFQPGQIAREAFDDRGNRALRVLSALQGVPGGTTTSTSGGGLSGMLSGALGGGAAAYGMQQFMSPGRQPYQVPYGVG